MSHSTETTASPKAGPSDDHRPARASRPPRPNYKHIHRFPLPLNVPSVPPLIPHNPLSIISVALSYLTFLVSPPHQEVYSAYFDLATSSIHVTDQNAIKALWEMGFFGKGSLSRSEPSWLEREKKRRGLLGGNTSEEVTRKRRSERRELKLERARAEKLAIEERLQAEAAARSRTESIDHPAHSTSINGTANGAVTSEKFSLRKAKETKFLQPQDPETSMDSIEHDSPAKRANGKTVRFSSVVQEKVISSQLPESSLDRSEGDDTLLHNEEHLQLSNEEAFFLVYGLGILRVFDLTHAQGTIIPTLSLFLLFCHHSYYPPRAASSPSGLEPDDPFIISYAVYHHFRSLGWVVHTGVKFGVDYLLYNRGPVFAHAEFAVVVIPSYDHPYWAETEERRNHAASKQARGWWWLHCVNRVQAHVKKSLVVCYVEVPPPADSSTDIGALLARYRVREFSIRRWVPNRSRD